MFYPSRALLVAILAFTATNGNAMNVDAFKHGDLNVRQEVVTVTVTECDAVPTEPIVPPVIETTTQVPVPSVEVETTTPTPHVQTTESVPVVTTPATTIEEVTSVPETTLSTMQVSSDTPEPTPSAPEVSEASTTVPLVIATDGAVNGHFDNALLGGAIGLAAVLAF